MTGARVVVILAAIAFATVVLPPTAAWTVNRRRIDRANSDSAKIAGLLATRLSRERNATPRVAVLFGPGRLPFATSVPTEAWLTAPRGSLAAVIGQSATLRSDPWGNAYLINVRASGGCTVLSAGPNGTIETPFSGPVGPPVGDDIVSEIGDARP